MFLIDSPLRVEYKITPLAKELDAIFIGLDKWVVNGSHGINYDIETSCISDCKAYVELKKIGNWNIVVTTLLLSESPPLLTHDHSLAN